MDRTAGSRGRTGHRRVAQAPPPQPAVLHLGGLPGQYLINRDIIKPVMLSVGLLILVVVTNVLLAAFVIVNNARGILNRILCLLSIILAAWSVIAYFEDTQTNVDIVNILVKLDFILASLMLLLFFWFCHALVRSKIRTTLWIACILAALCTLLAAFGKIVKVDVLPDHVAFIGQVGYPLFLAYIVLGVVSGLTLLVMRYRHVSGKERNQLQFIFLGLFITSLALTTTNVVLPNIVETSPEVTRIGIYSALFLTGSMAYAIIRHHFMDIRLAVARAVAYGLLLTTLAGLYAGAFLSISKLFFIGSQTTTGQNIVNISLVVALAATFQPLKRFFEKITDSIFYRSSYDAEALLSNLGTIMAREIELDKLTVGVIDELSLQMKLSKITIVVLDKNEIFYEANESGNNHLHISLDDLKSLGSGVVLKDYLTSEEIKKAFDKYGVDTSVDLRSSNELVGYLLLGEKKNGDIFNSTDIKTLSILAHELAIAIHNAKSYTQIQNFNKTLQKRIDEATEQLRDANEHLKELDQLKNEFLSMATHQLNTPLTVVDGYLTLINDGVVSETEERKDYIEKTLERVHAMKRMVTDFLNVSRIETGKFIIDVKPVDFNKLVSEEVNGLGPSAKEKEVLLQLITPKHPVPFIEIDEQKTRQAVMNLVDNAIYYTPKGEVKVFLEADKKNVTFKVVDNGIGVPENQKAKLFGKFFRADNARQERPNGNGVGLYLVKRIVEDQGGKIIFESTAGKGSTFGFSLPIKSALPKNADAPQEKPKEPAAA
jgi:signal transduction histidine kinase